MDPFKLLKTDHKKVAGLFEELESASGSAAKLRVFEQIKTELDLHTHIEEKIFYPALEEPKETHEITLEAYEEHNVVKRLLQELSRAKNANDEWEAKAKVLQENVEHHVEEEENELFKKAKSALSKQELETLGDEMEAEKMNMEEGAAASKSTAAKKTDGKTTKSTKTASASKSSSRSTAAKTVRPSRSKKSAKKR